MSSASIKNKVTTCLCGSDKSYTECCQPFHEGMPAPKAELLMRSRYSAYALMLEGYLLNTWHPDTRPNSLNLAGNATFKWLGLTIKRTKATGKNTAIVEFVARYKDGGDKAERLHEISNFILVDRWYYVDGNIIN